MSLPTKTLRLIRFLAIFTLITLVSNSGFSQGPDEIDTFLSTPVPASPIPEEIAKTTVTKGNELAAGAASRKDEITAYLIPFQRALAVPTDSKPAATPVPTGITHPKPFLILKTSDGVAEFFKAATVVTQGDFVIAQSTDGKKGMWQKNRFVTQLPWFTDEELDTGNIELEKLALRYKVLELSYPTLKAVLHSEMERIQAVDRKHSDAIESKKAKLKENAERIIAQSQSYSLEHAYTREELAQMLLEAEEARKNVPDLAEKIDKAMAPFRVHFENLLANRVFVEGAWQNKAEVDEKLARQKAEEEEQAFQKDLRFEINAASVSKSGIRNLFAGLILLAVVVFVIGLYLLIGQTSIAARALGVLFCLAPATLGIYGNSLLSGRNPNTPSFTTEKPAGTNKVIRALHRASKPATEPVSELDRRITMRESDLNSFVKDYVTFVGAPSTPDCGIYRTDLAFQLLSDGVIVWELAHYKDCPLRVRYDLKTEVVGGALRIADFKVVVGNFTLPRPFAGQMLNNLTTELVKVKKGRALLEAYKVTRLTDGETDFTIAPPQAAAPAPRAKTAATPDQAQQPKPTAAPSPASTQPATIEIVPAPASPEQPAATEQPGNSAPDAPAAATPEGAPAEAAPMSNPAPAAPAETGGADAPPQQ